MDVVMPSPTSSNNYNSERRGFWDFFDEYCWRKIFGRAVKTAFYVSRGAFWVKIYFLKKSFFSSFLNFEHKSFEIFSRVRKTGFYVPRGTFWSKLFFLKKKISIIFRLWVNFFPFFGENFPVWLSKMHFMCPDGHFGVFTLLKLCTNFGQHLFQREFNW